MSHLTVVPDPKWWERANCLGTDSEAFFPEKGGTPAPAKRICRGCDVRRECLEDALTHDERYGVRGGMTFHERKALKKKRRTAQSQGAAA
jgi:WhiB family redox-sensing transcriptional regulator